jgi:methyl-accepting chemotaxis protein
VAAHEDTIKAAIGHLGEIESIAGGLAEGDALRQALTFRAVISNYALLQCGLGAEADGF